MTRSSRRYQRRAFFKSALFAVCLSLAVPAAAQAPAGADRAALAAEKAALFSRMQRNPADPDLTLAYAGVAARLDDDEAAAGALERVLIQNPSLAGAALELGVLYFRMGSFKAARAYLARARAADASPEMARRIAPYEEIARIDRLRPPGATAPGVALASLPAPPPSPRASAVPPGAPQRKVGTTAAVNENAVAAAVAGATRRRLAVPDPLFTRERVRTDAQGQVQILLEDASTVTIGPDSDLAVDDFVFDPRVPAGGKMALDVERGRLLLIGGGLSKQPNAVSIRTPSATLAVRGAIVLLVVDANGRTWAVLLYGNQLSVTGADGVTQTITETGFATSVDRPGAAPSLPAAVSVAELARVLATLDGRPGGNGGAAVVPTEATLARSGIAQIISGNLLDSVRQALHATLDEAAVAVAGLLQLVPQAVGQGQGPGLTTNQCVTISPSRPCR